MELSTDAIISKTKAILMLPDHTLVNVLIVDDEMEACTNLKNILMEYVDRAINIVGIANNTREAEKQITRYAPNAVFLDIEMPNENAFHFLTRISPFDFEVIFVTAYDEHAVKAFKLNAVDYILKPISITELAYAVQKLKERIRYKKMIAGNVTPYADIAGQVNNKVKSQRITLKDSNTIEVVEFRDIYFIEAQGSYVRIIFLKNNEAKEIMLSGSLTDYEDLLPADLFFRIHKSYLINCAHVRKIIKDEYNQVVIKDSYTLPVSRRRYAQLLQFLKSNDYYNE